MSRLRRVLPLLRWPALALLAAAADASTPAGSILFFPQNYPYLIADMPWRIETGESPGRLREPPEIPLLLLAKFWTYQHSLSTSTRAEFRLFDRNDPLEQAGADLFWKAYQDGPGSYRGLADRYANSILRAANPNALAAEESKAGATWESGDLAAGGAQDFAEFQRGQGWATGEATEFYRQYEQLMNDARAAFRQAAIRRSEIPSTPAAERDYPAYASALLAYYSALEKYYIHLERFYARSGFAEPKDFKAIGLTVAHDPIADPHRLCRPLPEPPQPPLPPQGRRTWTLTPADNAHNRNWARTVMLPPGTLAVKDGSLSAAVIATAEEREMFRPRFTGERPRVWRTDLRTRLAPDPLPLPTGWFAGDMHIHQECTDDRLEFGNPLEDTARAARLIGLRWIALADHSSDFDSWEDWVNFDGSSTGADAKWRWLQDKVRRVNREGRIAVVPGEEVNVRNDAGEFCHLLISNFHDEDSYLPGEGADAAGLNLRFRLFGRQFLEEIQASGESGKITYKIPEILPRLKPYQLAYLAHPLSQSIFEKGLFKNLEKRIANIPIKIWTNYGSYHEEDFKFILSRGKDGLRRFPQVAGWQFWNWPGAAQELPESLKAWDRWLARELELKPVGKIFAGAGSDSHGDFNYPFRGYKGAVGIVRTALYIPEAAGRVPTTDEVVEGLRRGRSVLTSGPFALLAFNTTAPAVGLPCQIGEWSDDPRHPSAVVVKPGEPPVVTVRWLSTPEFGEAVRLRIVGRGRRGWRVDRTLEFPVASQQGTRLDGWLTLPLPPVPKGTAGFVRVELESRPPASGADAALDDPWRYFCYTNPVWFSAP